MENTMYSPKIIREKRFSIVKKGYSPEEVNSFVNDVAMQQGMMLKWLKDKSIAVNVDEGFNEEIQFSKAVTPDSKKYVNEYLHKGEESKFEEKYYALKGDFDDLQKGFDMLTIASGEDKETIKSQQEFINKLKDDIQRLQELSESKDIQSELTYSNKNDDITDAEATFSKNDTITAKEKSLIKKEDDLKQKAIELEDMIQRIAKKDEELQEKENDINVKLKVIEKNKSFISEDYIEQIEKEKEEIDSMDKAMKELVIVAQKKAEAIMKESNAKAAEILESANAHAKEIMDEAAGESQKMSDDAKVLLEEANSKRDETLNMAKTQAETILREASDKSEEILKKAKEDAEKIIDDALLEKEKVSKEMDGIVADYNNKIESLKNIKQDAFMEIKKAYDRLERVVYSCDDADKQE